jgi:branched-subunit amino acid aminotransferase/4-amino-4-deoxychorismate lyase
MTFQYFSKNGTLLPFSDATIPLENIAYQYGFGVYETLKVRGGILYFAKQHIERLLQSAKIIDLKHMFTPPKINLYIQKVIQKNNVENCNIKILLIGGKEAKDSLLFILPLAPLFPDKKLYSRGATVSTVQYKRFLPNAKTLNMLRSYLYYTKASREGHYDALFLDKKGNILEGSRTNFFAIKGTTLTTPPKEKVLEGVTRQTVIAAAKKSGFVVKEENIPISKLKKIDGAFLTCTSGKIIPLVQVGNLKFPEIPPKLKELMQIYNEFLKASGGIFAE